MDARLKYRHLLPADMVALKAKISQVNKDTVHFNEQLSLLAKSRDSVHASKMHRIHFVIWFETCRKQQEIVRDLLSDLKALTFDKSELNLCKCDDTGLSLIEILTKQSHDFVGFTDQVIKPLSQLRSQIKTSTQSNEALRTALREAYSNIESEMQRLLQKELEITDFPPTSRLDTFKRLRAKDTVEDANVGIPVESWAWDTHDESFRADLLAEFIHLDSTFINRVDGVKNEFFSLEAAYGLNKWKVHEFLLVEFLWDVYSALETPQKRQTCVDLLNRIPSLDTSNPYSQLLEFFQYHDLLKMRMEGIVSSWSRARQELSDRIHVTLEDAIEAHRRKSMGKESIEKQRALCQQLANKVQKWRKEKGELEELELRSREAKMAIEMARDQERQMKENRRRQEIKNMIQTQKAAKIQEKIEFEAAERLRLEELRRVLDKQRRKDTQRLLQIAKDRLKQQLVRRVEASDEATRQAEATEARLEAIRVKVRPAVPEDPLRVFANTAAWRHRLEAVATDADQTNTSGFLQTPPFSSKPITTFTEDQLQRDRRTRISTALFEAGLLNSNYARDIVAHIPLPRPPPRLLQISPIEAPPRPSRRPQTKLPRSDIFNLEDKT